MTIPQYPGQYPPHHQAPYPYPMPHPPARQSAVPGLRATGIAVQSVLALFSLVLVTYASIFALTAVGSAGRGFFYLAAGGIAVWTIAGPFLYALLTRSTRSVVWTIVAFFGCGPIPPLVVGSIAFAR